MRNAVLMVFRISVFRRTFAAETFAIVKLYIKRVGSLSAACFCDFEFATRLQEEYRNFAP